MRVCSPILEPRNLNRAVRVPTRTSANRRWPFEVWNEFLAIAYTRRKDPVMTVCQGKHGSLSRQWIFQIWSVNLRTTHMGFWAATGLWSSNLRRCFLRVFASRWETSQTADPVVYLSNYWWYILCTSSIWVCNFQVWTWDILLTKVYVSPGFWGMWYLLTWEIDLYCGFDCMKTSFSLIILKLWQEIVLKAS